MKIDYSMIGRRIKEKRRGLKKTQDDLAEALGVSVGYISQIERGVTKISLDTLGAICVFLDCDIGEMVSNTLPQQSQYLSEELVDLFKTLSANQKKLLLEFAGMISQYECKSK